MKRLLFATDFSTSADNAMSYALKLAEDIGANVTIIHSASAPLTHPLTTTEEELAELIEQIETQAREKITQLLENYPGHRVTKIEVRSGKFIDSEISEYAEEEGSDLIIMGMKGEQGRLDKLLGSVTTYLMMKASCPVLAIPEHSSYEPIIKVALATELPSAEDMPMQQLSRFVSSVNATLNFVTVDNIVRRSVKFQPNQIKTTYFGRDYDVVQNASIPDGLNDYVKTTKVNVLSLYMRKRKLWERLFHISISKEMVYYTEIPLLVFHE